MNKYRKKQLIEAIEDVVDSDGNVTGVRVQNEGKPDDTWVIPIDVFHSTYEAVTE